MRLRLAALLLLALCLPAHAADTMKTEAETLALSKKAMDLTMGTSPSAAFEALKPYWPMEAVEIDAVSNQLGQQWPMVESRLGKPLSYELLSTEHVGTSFVRYTFLQKFERHALRWTFSYYRPKDGWYTNSFKFDDQIDVLYTEG